MGAGKSTIGQRLAKALGWAFTDTDRALSQRFGLSIPEIFKQKGEPAFREAELALVRELAGAQRLVVSTGGGALAREDAWEALREGGGEGVRVVYLYAPPAALFERVIFSPRERPMIDVPDAEVRFHERFAQREPFYRRAHFTVSTDGRRPEDVVAEIVAALAVDAPQETLSP